MDRRLCALGVWKAATWDDALGANVPKLYAGNIDRTLRQFATHYGITPFLSSSRNIRHDIRHPLPIPDNSVGVYQSEDVFEHIEYLKIGRILCEIYRVLRPGGLFRFSVPDYRCPIFFDRSLKDDDGRIVFDPGGGGRFESGKVVEGGHLWFPVYEVVKTLFDESPFEHVRFLHYTDQKGQSVLNPIDYALGYVQRTPDNDTRISKTSPRIAISIVVDAQKQAGSG